MRPDWDELRPLLRCPATHQPLSPTGDGHLATASGERYPIIHRTPVLIDEARSLFRVADIAADPSGALPHAARRGAGALLARLRRMVPNNSRNVGAHERFEHLAALLRARTHGRSPRVLLIGAQIPGAGTSVVTDSPDISCVETDIHNGPRTQVVCDAHQLPFSDGAFDAVVAQAMLDMVADPEEVAREVHRVLAPDGLVLSEVAFMQQIRGGVFDFNRYTLLGHRRLWRRFDQIDAGAQCGPGMALAWSLTSFVQAFPRSPRLAFVLKRIMQIATAWLPLFDTVLTRRPGGIDAASGTYFLGSRRDTALTDREVVASYQGFAQWGLKPEAQSSPGIRPGSSERRRAA